MLEYVSWLLLVSMCVSMCCQLLLVAVCAERNGVYVRANCVRVVCLCLCVRSRYTMCVCVCSAARMYKMHISRYRNSALIDKEKPACQISYHPSRD
jgi:hypothetical protein